MNRAEVLKVIEESLSDILDREGLALSEETTADSVEGWDSINHVKLVIGLEDDYGVEFTPAEVDALKTVGDLLDLVLAKTGGK